MRMRASWRDPYRGVPLMFTSSSPGCSLRDRAAFPPSSTWQRDGRQGGTTPKVSQLFSIPQRGTGVPSTRAPRCGREGSAVSAPVT